MVDRLQLVRQNEAREAQRAISSQLAGCNAANFESLGSENHSEEKEGALDESKQTSLSSKNRNLNWQTKRSQEEANVSSTKPSGYHAVRIKQRPANPIDNTTFVYDHQKHISFSRESHEPSRELTV
jgi:hypothetical protein